MSSSQGNREERDGNDVAPHATKEPIRFHSIPFCVLAAHVHSILKILLSMVDSIF